MRKGASYETIVENMLIVKMNEESRRRESWELLNAMNVENMLIVKLYEENRRRKSWEFFKCNRCGEYIEKKGMAL